MRNHLFAAGFAAAVLIPSMALAQQTCEQRSTNRAVGTLAGAGIGALLGSTIAGHDDRTAGAVVGGVGGAIVGNQLSKGSGDCTHAYGFYDNDGAWHASTVRAESASGYYDRSGAWVNGAPSGYYDRQGSWVMVRADASAAGYYDQNRRWVPASAGGYYDVDGRWVAGVASGHYEPDGRWIASPSVGRYDAHGRWLVGEAAGHTDSNGRWVADVQPGYYDNGHWRVGQAQGYYDARGGWRATATFQPDARAEYRGAGYQSADWSGAPADVRSRQGWLRTRIEQGMQSGALRHDDGDRAMRDLNKVGDDMQRYRGNLRRNDARRFQARLDDISTSLRWQRNEGARQY
jgi:hypothetical protein